MPTEYNDEGLKMQIETPEEEWIDIEREKQNIVVTAEDGELIAIIQPTNIIKGKRYKVHFMRESDIKLRDVDGKVYLTIDREVKDEVY